QNRAAFCPPQWEDNKNTHFFKIKNRILNDYEREGVFSAGSVERILQGMQKKIDMVLPDLDNRQSYIVIFVVEHNGDLLYPGEVPALVKYFERKLKNSLSGGKKAAKKPAGTYQNCSICGKDKSGEVTLDKVFKFATFDKVSVLAGLDKKEIPHSFAVCQSCYEQISSGREKVDRILRKGNLFEIFSIKKNKKKRRDVFVWAIPEVVGSGDLKMFERFLYSWEEKMSNNDLAGTGEKTEEQYFTRLAKTGQGLIFHFVFWEKNNAQEIVHLMTEDVPPERLARLETTWKKVNL
ncbi:MAG TPA: hypothetical protein DD811_11165, partial [Syntrophomonas sp.]|nr:hypothetical protein [Syntrophomonas sp.]